MKALKLAEAEGTRATKLAEAEGTQATLLAEAEGKAKLAQATAAEGEINLRQVIAEMLIEAEVRKIEALGTALQGIGQNVRIVQFGGADGVGSGNAFLETLKTVPELATIINAKAEALSGENLEELLGRVARFIAAGKEGAQPASAAEVRSASPRARSSSRRSKAASKDAD